MAIIRSVIERITLTPREDGTLELLPYGELARKLQFCEAGEWTSHRPSHGKPGREHSWRGLGRVDNDPAPLLPRIIARVGQGCGP
jgi:hypothetical protein